ncbi:MAG: HDIG domain-containing metalloprotein [Pirellulaceae bacterium]
MSYAPGRRHRNQRGAALHLPPNFFARSWEVVRKPEVLVRIGLFAAAALLMWLIVGGGAPPFSYRTGDVPARKMIARIDFQLKDDVETAKRKDDARRLAEVVYVNDVRLLDERRQELTNKVGRLVLAESFEAMQNDKELQSIWLEFLPPDPARPPDEDQRRFDTLKTYFTAGMDSNRYDGAISAALEPFKKFGLLKEHKPKEGSQVSILVHPPGVERPLLRAAVDDVRLDKAKVALRQRLDEELKIQGSMLDNASVVAELTYAWLDTRLPETLAIDNEATTKEANRVVEEVETVMVDYKSGVAELAGGGKPLGEQELFLLKSEYDAWKAQLGFRDWLSRSLATLGLYLALSVLCGFYIFHRRPRLLSEFRRFATLLTAVVITVGLAWIASADQWRAEIIPLLLFGMTAAIAYEKELALLLSASVALIIAFSLQQGLAEFVILVSSVAAAILFLRRIRSRTKLIYVGAFTGIVVFLTTIGVGTLVGRAFGATNLTMSWATPQMVDAYRQSFYLMLLLGSAGFGFCSVLAGVLMTGLLPFIERMFDVQTDISLLELGDVQHPLLQELVRRAPGTYNHSINVASIAETAAEAIEANGLLVRVGAYFHDIGKMLKPAYFVENQGPDGNRHESLQPAMSTLVIIAHVKDGADLARRHHLPQSIIDFIEQHHGTTLVEYFYRREAQRLKDDPDAGELDETTFRYPGPQPQTKEAAVLMLGDVVESASRALVDPTPARIESLVHDLAMKRLLDGQFDECGLTLSELKIIEDSLVKSLTAVYHGRVKYPEHQTV